MRAENRRIERVMQSIRRKFGLWRWSMIRRARFRFNRPKTLNEKIQYKMALDRRPLLTTFADKWAVREYVAKRVGHHVLNEVYFAITDLDDADLARLPDRCVIKPSHGSGSVIVVDDRAPPASLPEPGVAGEWLFTNCRVRRADLDLERLEVILDDWLRNAYPTVEWAYHRIPPRIIVERYIEGEGQAPPADYKFFVMHGDVAFIQVDVNRFEGHRRQLFYPPWEPVPVDYKYPRPDTLPQRPGCLDRMLEVASALGADTDFVRVDLYDADGSVLFGELTNYPVSGRGSFSDHRIAVSLAERWIVPRSYASLPAGSP